MIVSGETPIQELEKVFKTPLFCKGFPDNYSQLDPDNWLYYTQGPAWSHRYSHTLSPATSVWLYALSGSNKWRVGRTVSLNLNANNVHCIAQAPWEKETNTLRFFCNPLERYEQSPHFVFQTPCGSRGKETMTWQLVTGPKVGTFASLWVVLYKDSDSSWYLATEEQIQSLHKYFVKALSRLRTVRNTTLGIQPKKRDMEAAKLKNDEHVRRLKQAIAYQDSCQNYVPKLRKLEELVKTLRESAEKGYMVSNAFHEMESQTIRVIHAGNVIRSKYRLLSADTLEECVQRTERALLGKHPSNKDKDKD